MQGSKRVGTEAARENPHLEPLRFLIGEWRTEGSHPLMPGKALHGRATFEWAEGGAFLIWRSEIDEPEIPSGIAIIGTDDDSGEFAMLYFDERGVSRHYRVEAQADGWRFWRDSPKFSQRFTTRLADG